jgi:hypothetical protein
MGGGFIVGQAWLLRWAVRAWLPKVVRDEQRARFTVCPKTIGQRSPCYVGAE